MVKWPFSRKKAESSDLPPEIQDYYQAEKREKVGVAGLLAVATLIATILIAMALFFGGRWVYRALFKDDKKNTPQTAQQTATNNGSQAPTSSDGPAPAPSPAQNTPASNPAPTLAAPNPSGGKSSLPNTGTGKGTIVIFLGTVLVSSVAYYVAAKPKRVTVVAE